MGMGFTLVARSILFMPVTGSGMFVMGVIVEIQGQVPVSMVMMVTIRRVLVLDLNADDCPQAVNSKQSHHLDDGQGGSKGVVAIHQQEQASPSLLLIKLF